MTKKKSKHNTGKRKSLVKTKTVDEVLVATHSYGGLSTDATKESVMREFEEKFFRDLKRKDIGRNTYLKESHIGGYYELTVEFVERRNFLWDKTLYSVYVDLTNNFGNATCIAVTLCARIKGVSVPITSQRIEEYFEKLLNKKLANKEYSEKSRDEIILNALLSSDDNGPL